MADRHAHDTLSEMAAAYLRASATPPQTQICRRLFFFSAPPGESEGKPYFIIPTYGSA